MMQEVTAQPTEQDNDYLQKGHTFLHKLRYIEALAAYKQALCLDPYNADILLYKGRVLFYLQRPYEALIALEHALQLNPALTSAYQEQSTVFTQLGKQKEAQMASEHARDGHTRQITIPERTLASS